MSLELLNISDNTLKGTLPPEIGELTGLTELNLAYNEIGGIIIPSEVGELSKLKVVWLHGNKFTSKIPTELGALAELTDLRLQFNALTGSLPTELGQLKSLTVLDAGVNKLSGTLPDLGNAKWLTQLRELYFGKNDFSGTVPSWIVNIPEKPSSL
jgi:Leucine-rich repeat (LRR) protein